MSPSGTLAIRAGWRANALAGAGFALLGALGVLSAAPGHNEAPIWPAAGVGLAAVWLRGASILPGLAIGAFLAAWLAPGVRFLLDGGDYHLAGIGAAAAAAAASGNLLAAWAGGTLLRSGERRLRLESVASVLHFWLACLVYAVISAAVGASAVVAATPAPLAAWPEVALTWGSGDLVGSLVVAPLVRLMAGGIPRPGRIAEVMAILACLALTVAVGLGQIGPARIPSSFIIFLPLLWAALRLPPLWTALAVAAVAAAAFSLSLLGHGPFAGFGSQLPRLLGLQAFIVSIAMSAHLLAMVTAERAAAMAELRASEERFRLLGESSGDLVGLHRLDGRLTWVSPSVRTLLGMPPDALLGQEPLPYVHPDDRRRLRLGLSQAALAGEPARRVRFRARRADGGWLWLEASASLVRDAAGVAVAIQTASRDISSQVAYEAELGQARLAAEAAARTKATFLAAMSHEIRTPLNGVIGMAELLAEEPLPPRAREAAATIRGSGESLLAILNDILDFSKIEAGRLELAPAAVDPVAVASAVCALFAQAAADKDLALSLEPAADAPRMVIADPARLRQAIANLVANAVKFTRRGGVRVRIARDPPGPGLVHGALAIAVSDTGPGIPAEAMDRLFRDFSQVDAGLARRHGGTGLGLAISRRLVEAMRGCIGVESRPGDGAVFTIRLPLPDPALAAAGVSPPTPEDHPQVRRGLRVLLAEDDLVNQTVVLGQLGRFGATVRVAGDGAAAIVAWEEGGVDLVLMDMQMPGLDGLSATRAIREREAARGLPRTPIVALTANAFPEDRSACLEAGMDGLVAKPLTLAALGEALALYAPRPQA